MTKAELLKCLEAKLLEATQQLPCGHEWAWYEGRESGLRTAISAARKLEEPMRTQGLLIPGWDLE